MSKIDDDDNALFESLENEYETDPSIAHLREARLQQLSSDLSRAKTLKSEGYGIYTEIKDEKGLLDVTTSHKRCVVHFFKSDFNRCRIMDGHLSDLAEKHLETRICKMNVENAPFLVTKLNVKVLPCVIPFVDGLSVDRIVGFEGLGYGEDNFETKHLEKRLISQGVMDSSFKNLEGIGSTQVQQGQHEADTAQAEDDGDLDEWD